MQVDWNAFTPAAALAGGALIGAAAALLWWFNGRIAGISGIVGGLLPPTRGDTTWRLAFVSGLLVAPWLVTWLHARPAIQVEAPTAVLVVAGLLVGFGTRLASGCTSGHGVCGLSRWSPRSAVATLCFMAAGFATVAVARAVWAAV